ncbi:MAG: hypothetical protein K1060chlam4_00832 [Candidatus Anoxychlamydiales bacterium]|nr:hypothetical protein [Candidatus Anoxychlamydiales bacterium]
MASSWQLPAEIIALSRAKTWVAAVQEWDLDYIERLEAGEDSESCLCGNTPIIELCHIINTKTQNTAVVGNHCIQKFEKDDPAHAVFGNAPKVFRSINKLLNDSKATASKALLDYASKKGVLTKSQLRGYEEDKGKRNLRFCELKYRVKINNLLIFGIAVKTEKAAYKRLFQDPDHDTTAGPKLIKYAFEKRVLTKSNYDFYIKIWDKAHGSLTVKQKKYKVDLNKKIINQLKADFIDNREIQNSCSSSSSYSSSSSIISSSTNSIRTAAEKRKKREEEEDFDLIDLSSSSEERVTIRSAKRSRNVIESDDEISEF